MVAVCSSFKTLGFFFNSTVNFAVPRFPPSNYSSRRQVGGFFLLTSQGTSQALFPGIKKRRGVRGQFP